MISKEERLKREIEIYRDAVLKLWDYKAEVENKVLADFPSDNQEEKLFKALGTSRSDRAKAAEYNETYAEWVTTYSNKLIEAYRAGDENIIALLNDAQKELLENYIKNEDLRNSYIDAYSKKQREKERELVLLRIDYDNELKDSAIKLAKEIAETNARRLETEKNTNSKLLNELDIFYKENYDKSLTAQQRELGELAIHYGNQLQLLIEAKDKELITEDEYNKRRLQIVSTYDKEREKVNLSYLEESLNRRLELINDSISRESQLYANKEAALTAKRGVYETSVYDLGLFATGGEFYQSKQNIEDEYEAAKKFNEDLYNLTVARVNRENELLGEQLVIYKEMLDNKLILQQDYENKVESISLQQEANEILRTNANKQRNEDDLQAFKDVQEKKQQALQATASVASSLAGAAANFAKQESQNDKKSEKEREKAFKVYKALATTQAVIDTVSSAQSAYKSMVGIPYVGPVLAPIAAAAAIALGIANIRSIQQETLPSSEGSASVSAPTALNAPPIEYSRTLLGDQETENLNKPIKCYVVESDITDTQNKVATVEANASF